MEINLHLNEMGEKIYRIRKEQRMNQVDFYRDLFPEKDLEDENIKKKMNAIENGKNKRADYELLFRIREKYDVSLDYLFGFETEYPSYENKAASMYTGLSSEAVGQLHYWCRYKGRKVPELYPGMTERQIRAINNESVLSRESEWILFITSKLLEKKSEKDEKTGIADLSVLYDIYMMSLEPPKTLLGIPEEILTKQLSFEDKIGHTVRVSANTVSYIDEMGEIHQVDIRKMNQQVWKERLIKDLEVFITELRSERQN